MNSAALPSLPNQKRSWLSIFVFIFLLQVLLIYVLSSRPAIISARPINQPVPLQLFPKRLSETQFAEHFLVSDPTLYASANLHGFSGRAWLKEPPHAYEKPNFVERSEPPYWLGLNLRQFGTSVGQFLETTAAAGENFFSIAAPQIQFAQNGAALLQSKTNSTFRVEGELTERALLNPPQLPIWSHTGLLSNSVAQIMVDKFGVVLSAKLLEQSGYAQADNAALDLARTRQFSPSAEADLRWGKLIFDWQTVPGAETNSEPKTVQP